LPALPSKGRRACSQDTSGRQKERPRTATDCDSGEQAAENYGSCELKADYDQPASAEDEQSHIAQQRQKMERSNQQPRGYP
jgi:hypothetical protein